MKGSLTMGDGIEKLYQDQIYSRLRLIVQNTKKIKNP